MRRLHLFEFEDQSWLPSVFRDFITDQLLFTHSEPMRVPVNRAVARHLRALIERTGTRQIVDLCSGAGGPIARIAKILADELSLPVRVVVTDRFPNAKAFRTLERESAGQIEASFDSVDATDVPAELAGVRTLFTALHHFRPDDVRRVLGDAVKKRAPIAVFEPLERSVRMVTLVGAMSFIRGFTHAHRVGKLTAARAFFSWILPIAPAMFAWDGAVSAVRSYTADELVALAKDVDPIGYEWSAGRFEFSGPYGQMPTTYLFGLPAAA